MKLKITLKTFWYFCWFIIYTIYSFQISHAFEKKNRIDLKVENFFQSLSTMQAKFVQVSPSGKISKGKIYLDLPGKLRVDYEKPSNLLITCKGFWIVIQNRKLKTTNNIPLKQTPFSILLENKIDFKNDYLTIDVTNELGVISLKAKVAKNPKAGELIIEFSEKPFILKKWIIKNVLGEKTTVLIQDAVYNQNLSFKIFFPEHFPDTEN